MDSDLRSLPPELEENLAKIVERVMKRRAFPCMNLCNVLKAISMTFKTEPKFKETINDRRWIEGFKKRWAHKLCGAKQEGGSKPAKPSVYKPISSSTTVTTIDLTNQDAYEESTHRRFQAWQRRQGYKRRLPSYSELHGSAEPPLLFTTRNLQQDNQRRRCPKTRDVSQQKRRCGGVMSEESEFSDADSSDICESSSECDESDSTDTSISSQQSFDKNEVTDSEGVKSDSEWRDYKNEFRRASMGLRNVVKPVDRFQIPSKDDEKKQKTSAQKKFKPLSVVTSSDEESSISDEEARTSSVEVVEDKSLKQQKKFDAVRDGKIKLEDMCLTCGTTKEIKAKHPLFIGGLCKEHKTLFHEWFFKYDSDGYHSYCSVCCMGNEVVLCDIQDCGRCYCQECLDSLVQEGYFDQAVNSEHWICNFCSTSRKSLLVKRPEWQEEIQELYKISSESQFPPFPVPPPIPVNKRRPIRVLSLFDGISTGLVALKQLGLQIEKFVASEIDEDAIRLVQNKHPEVIHIGDITKLTDDELYDMGPFDILLGGSPCNDLSGANPRRRGLLDAEGSGCLFFDFYRVLRTIEPPRAKDGRRHERPFFWLFENVVSMKGIEKRRISRFLQCEPKKTDARYVSAAARPRLFWGNIPGLRDRTITPGVKDRLSVQDCLEPGRKALVEKLNTITTKYTCLYQGQSRQAPVMHDDKEDVLWTTEVERVFGVPEHYTDVNNLGPRERLALLGRSWSVPVVRLLLSPLKEYFSGMQPSDIKGERLPNATWWN